ncbi:MULTISPECIES: hypothetical protein [Rhodococcus]|uniref:Hypothetical membrane protein n=1 Tax=Rhodococcus opacus (strain B4) TaxID=632772 RepID=C1AZE9_RHOOB|nr:MULTISPECIES: hypothetical protein [Rhodococcus]PBC57194.1 hypothetical protein CJ177_16695 [Rhodococcus sp. ACPA1]RZK71555.1 MAG: hypothetical protein EOP25_04810 [Rhodococcus sp. (in: high G+C Gram-positive bacteria)]UDG95748.1 hypothetical protein K2Z90_005912 [Rhodococcus opacus PD630]BAH50077.1 hypothetical membrane protein [Rhodococcus opacus B4]
MSAVKLNLFAAWVSFALVLLSVVCLGGFLVAAGSGQGGWAVISGSLCVVALAGAMALYGGTVRHDHRLHHETPHLF